MNRPLRHPQEATQAVSLPWTAVVEPLMGLWEPVFLAGHPALYHCPSLARAFAKGHPGATAIDMGMSAVRPTVEAIREAANPPRVIPEAFDINSLDPWKEHEQYQRAQGVGSDIPWGR